MAPGRWHTDAVTLGVVFLLVALGFAALGLAVAMPWAVLAAWCALAAALVGATLLTRNARPFGKRPDGRRRPLATLLLLPYLLPLWTAWRLQRWRDHEAPWHELRPWLLIGRRLRDHESAAVLAAVDHVVDLTCEHTEPPRLRGHRGYRCLPTVDGSTPKPAEFRTCIDALQALTGRVYLHCAQGHGRTATFAAALLLVRGEARDPAHALQLVQARRPLARPYARQIAALERFWRDRRTLPG